METSTEHRGWLKKSLEGAVYRVSQWPDWKVRLTQAMEGRCTTTSQSTGITGR